MYPLTPLGLGLGFGLGLGLGLELGVHMELFPKKKRAYFIDYGGNHYIKL